MTCRFGQVLLLGGLLRRARLCGLLSITRLLLTLLRIAGLLFALLRVARLLFLILTIAPRQPFTRRLVAIARGARRIIASLSVCLSWRARGFSGKIGGRHKAVNFDYRDLAFDQSLYVSEKLQLFLVHQ